MVRREPLQILAVDRDLGLVMRLNMVEAVGQRHVTMPMVMPKRLSVRGHVDQTRTLPVFGKCIHQTRGEILSAM